MRGRAFTLLPYVYGALRRAHGGRRWLTVLRAVAVVAGIVLGLGLYLQLVDQVVLRAI